ncbi:hypothetical protein EIN_410000 [Entamoeba invadens IP1]|uniref:Uncharacterized protein n=1 Tax=Entamoeba invadens IP1 TaxID=370355 RepID=A0A0A1TWU8_ENTIV|nr:hypothetical protein EIN_410000 [Entamoeba invadens IP1]ELP85681.1 hypothetical protein EIN_410000 [Entamoeba invadens IP1]|eukprot:XP_004185027.1 hypothetical protein EIN_410000 [Entamoeba invadens IP1]
MYALSGFGGYEVISPLDACRGDQCRAQVTAIIKTCEALEANLKKADDTERELVKENEQNMEDMNMFTSHDETKVLRDKIRVTNENMRKTRKARRDLMRELFKVVGKLSIAQQGRLVRYLNLEHRIRIRYDDFKNNRNLPINFSTCKLNQEGKDPKLNHGNPKTLVGAVKKGVKRVAKAIF